MTISLEQVRLHGYHGVLAQERIVGAEYLLDVHLKIAPPYACVSDELTDTISYADVYDLVRHTFATPVKLLEHLSYKITEAILAQWPQVKQVKIKITKTAPPIPGFLGAASVSLTRP